MDCLLGTLSGSLAVAATKFPHRPAVSVPGRIDLTHSQLHRLVDVTASKLIASGIKPGQVVALAFPNAVEFVVLLLGVIRAKATAAPLNPAYTAEEFEFYLADSESKLLLMPQERIAAAQAAAAKLGIPLATAFLPPDRQDSLTISLTLSENESSDALETNGEDDVALFLHTSGTTSRPKGVPLTQLNLAASTRNIISIYKITESDSTVIVLPLFHVHGLIAALLSSLVAGASVTLPASGRFSASTFWKDMKACKATWYTAVPTIHQIILDYHGSHPEPFYPNLRFIRSCSASLAPAILAKLEEQFQAPVLEAYAMTEAAHLMSTNPLPEDGKRRPGTVGKPVAQEMTILNGSGEVQETGSVGEVCVRGPNVTRGYKNNPEANKLAFQFGWFHTGDIGYFDSDGYLHLDGRIKELINRGGEKISPIEVDAVLLSHPDVARAISFGVPDHKYGEEINCAVIPREGSDLKESDVTSFCKERLAIFKVPKKAFIAENFPMTASGKIQRRKVAEFFLNGEVK